MIYVTHDQTEAMTMGDKIVVLNKGMIEQFGTPQEIYSKPNSTFVARFLGSPAMNLIQGEIFQTGGKTIFSAPNFQLELGGINNVNKKAVLLGIRPEIFSVASEPTSGSLAEISGILTLSERLGSATNYYMESPLSIDGKLTASTHGNSGEYEIGEKIVFRMSDPQVHLFDPETGLRLI